MGANVTGVDSCSVNYTCCFSGCNPETTATTGGCPHILIIATPTPPCCCAGDNLWTRGYLVFSGVLRSEARRISTINSYDNSERIWRGEDTLLCTSCTVLHSLCQIYTYCHIIPYISLFIYVHLTVRIIHSGIQIQSQRLVHSLAD